MYFILTSIGAPSEIFLQEIFSDFRKLLLHQPGLGALKGVDVLRERAIGMGTEKYVRVVAVVVKLQESNVVIGSNVLSLII